MEGICNYGQRKPLSAQSLIVHCGRLEVKNATKKIEMVEVCLISFGWR